MQSDGSPAGPVVAVTGAGGGLGLLIVEALLRRGDNVIANHRSPSRNLDALAARFPELHLLAGDVADEDTAIRIAAIAAEIGRLDAVVLNAALTKDGPLVRMPTEDWDEVMRVNLRGPFLTTKHALRLMMRRKYGRFVYVSSLAGVVGNAGQANYAASKAALHGLSNSVAQEYSAYNIRSVVFAPGLLDTGLGAALPPSIAERKTQRSLLGLGDAQSVAATIAFLTSRDADFINGTVVHGHGGIAY